MKSELHIDSKFRLEVVRRILIDDRDADFERDHRRSGEFATEAGVEGQKETPGLTSDSRAEIPPNVWIWIESDKPAVGEEKLTFGAN